LLSANELTQSEQQQFQKQFDEKNFEINYDKEFMQVQTFSREEVLPLLPLLHEWLTKHLLGFPYYYAPPKEQLIHPFDTVYVNEKEALVVIAKQSNEVIGIASGISLGSFYLDYKVGNVFSSELIEQFKEKGFQPNEVLYVGYFLMAESHKVNARAVLEIFDQLIAAAKKWGKKQICYIQVLCDESRMKESPEPYGTIIPGFRHSDVVMLNLSWPTLQSDGSMQMQNHDMAFYIMDISTREENSPIY
jgi:hypothetical protein